MALKKPGKRRGRRAASSAPTTSTAHHTPPSRPRASTPQRSTSTKSSTFPDLLTVDEVAELLRTTRKGVYGLIYRGAFPGVIRLPGRILIDRAELLDFVSKRRGLSLSAQGEQR